MACYANGCHGQSSRFSISDRKCLMGIAWKNTVAYLEDCIIFSRTAEEHIERFCEVFQRFKDANLKMNPLECEVFRQLVPFSGHLVSQCGIQADPAKRSILRQYPVPNSVTELKSLLGTLFLLPTVRLRLRSNCSTSSSGNRENERIQLELGRQTGLWTTDR